MAHVGEILAELRNDRELSQKELGRALHIGGGTISCYERGSSLPNSDRIVQLADYFHVTTDYLLGRTSYNISPDYLSETICGGVTVHDFIELLRKIPEDRRHALYLLAKDACVNATLKNKWNHNGGQELPMIPYIILAIEDDDDREFMTGLYEQYKRLMYREILKIIQETWDVDDIMQTLFVKLIDRIALLKTLDRQRLIDYLVTAARNTALNFRRDNKAKYFEELTDEQPSPEDTEDALIRKEDLYRLANVWNTLDEKTQYLLRARYILNKSGKEIAADLKMSPDNVRMAIVRAKRRAKKAMEAGAAPQEKR